MISVWCFCEVKCRKCGYNRALTELHIENRPTWSMEHINENQAQGDYSSKERMIMIIIGLLLLTNLTLFYKRTCLAITTVEFNHVRYYSHCAWCRFHIEVHAIFIESLPSGPLPYMGNRKVPRNTQKWPRDCIRNNLLHGIVHNISTVKSRWIVDFRQ